MRLVLAASSARRSQTSLGYTQLIISAPETQREIKGIADFLRPKYFRTKSTRPPTEISSMCRNFFIHKIFFYFLSYNTILFLIAQKFKLVSGNVWLWSEIVFIPHEDNIIYLSNDTKSSGLQNISG